MTKPYKLNVAQRIIQQCGGTDVLKFIGVRMVIQLDGGVELKISSGPVSVVRIEYVKQDDLYRVDFVAEDGNTIQTFTDVSCDRLKKTLSYLPTAAGSIYAEEA